MYIFDNSAPSRVAVLLLPMPAVNNKSLNPSMTSLLISLGMLMSKLRVPATRCANVMPCFFVTMAVANVEAKSSTTITTSVGWVCK